MSDLMCCLSKHSPPVHVYFFNFIFCCFFRIQVLTPPVHPTLSCISPNKRPLKNTGEQADAWGTDGAGNFGATTRCVEIVKHHDHTPATCSYTAAPATSHDHFIVYSHSHTLSFATHNDFQIIHFSTNVWQLFPPTPRQGA